VDLQFIPGRRCKIICPAFNRHPSQGRGTPFPARAFDHVEPDILCSGVINFLAALQRSFSNMANDDSVFQENKIMLEFYSALAAANCIRRTYGPDHAHPIAGIVRLTIPEPKEWIAC
jgi:hypothetical protein